MSNTLISTLDDSLRLKLMLTLSEAGFGNRVIFSIPDGVMLSFGLISSSAWSEPSSPLRLVPVPDRPSVGLFEALSVKLTVADLSPVEVGRNLRVRDLLLPAAIFIGRLALTTLNNDALVPPILILVILKLLLPVFRNSPVIVCVTLVLIRTFPKSYESKLSVSTGPPDEVLTVNVAVFDVTLPQELLTTQA